MRELDEQRAGGYDMATLMQSYRRPRRQRQEAGAAVVSTVHPQDEKKIVAEINFRE